MTAVHAALARRFPAPEWATFFEVRDDAGFNARRSADVVAMNTWPSRGLAFHGVEVKVQRSDWLRELRDPAKSATIQRFCDYWWLAVPDDRTAKLEEIPERWGLLVLRGKSMVAIKDAPRLEPEPLTRGFVAAILRNATGGTVPKASVDELVEERLQARIDADRSMSKEDARRFHDQLAALRGQVEAFEKASGIRIGGHWDYGLMRDPTKVGEAVRLLISDQSVFNPDSIQSAKNIVERVAQDLAAAVDVIAALRPGARKETA